MNTSMILVDLQKAFDTINHKILLDKLVPIGFSKNTIILYELFCMKFANISYGVSQDSILGPLLFFIYVNDMSQVVECNLYLYSDH